MIETATDIGWRRVGPQEAHQRNLVCTECLRRGRGPQRPEYEQQQTGMALCFPCAQEWGRERAQAQLNPER
jgi:hypothetical protein